MSWRIEETTFMYMSDDCPVTVYHSVIDVASGKVYGHYETPDEAERVLAHLNAGKRAAPKPTSWITYFLTGAIGSVIGYTICMLLQ